ncbi:MAG: 1-deoxy-D-xylulose-5-phosphate synthase [Armatimonadota bacterium]|nr:1-deoxy-D-xylulose-5-phosphate synthase [Armatimonadota bacterium]
MSVREKILDRIHSPSDVKRLTEAQRRQLADEIRALIIDTVSRTGGHLASNLGAVELSIALHTAFDSPHDKIIWDVGHQSYAHKILTGRRDRFSTLRQGGGLSGFTKRGESEHDPFGAGHASTSISAALGLAKARDLRGGDEHVVAVIGDGAMTGGLALEGLNNAEQLSTDVIVVLNDNTMSIAENVGALAVHLSKLRMLPLYQKVESRAKDLVEKIPAGKTLFRTAEGISHGVIRLLGSKVGAVFEELGFTYLGPIDGHNMELMVEVFESAKKLRGPLLIHVVTKKGRGYEFAENNARAFHGISGFDVSEGIVERSSGNTSYTKVFGDTLVELASKDPRIVAITAAMPDGTGLARFAETFPDRFFDVGIAESHAVTFAAGLAAGGLRPVVACYSTFLQRAYDQIVHDVCLQGLPVIFAIDRAGLVGEDGPTHHGVFDLSYLRHIPGMVICAPKDTNELRDLLATALLYDGPIAIRYPRGAGPSEYQAAPPRLLDVGKGERLVEGRDAAIIAVGSMVYPAVAAAALLAEEGIQTTVVNARFVKPLDEDLILDVLKLGVPTLTVEDNVVAGGFGSAVLELASARGFQLNSLRCVGVPDVFAEHDSVEHLREQFGLSSSGIAQALKKMLAETEILTPRPVFSTELQTSKAHGSQ